MARWYRKPLAHGGHRMIKRGSSGRFARTTLSDLGMNECECCGGIFTPDLSRFEGQGMINPLEFNKEKNRRRCDHCLGLPEFEQERLAKARTEDKEPRYHCSKCGGTFTKDFSRCQQGSMVDPRLLRKEENRTICYNCEEEQQHDDSTG